MRVYPDTVARPISWATAELRGCKGAVSHSAKHRLRRFNGLVLRENVHRKPMGFYQQIGWVLTGSNVPIQFHE